MLEGLYHITCCITRDEGAVYQTEVHRMPRPLAMTLPFTYLS
jgi:hypothetical protein